MLPAHSAHRFRFLRSAGLAFALGSSTAGTFAATGDASAHWPQWRGPTANGLAPRSDPPIEWSEDKNVRWKVAIPGRGHATPIIWDRKIFVLTAVPVGDPPAPAPAATNPAPNPAAEVPAGQIQNQAPAQGEPRRGPGGGPRRGGGRGGFGGGDRPTQPHAFTVLCLDRATGKTLWERVARKAVPHQGVQPSNTFSSASPVTDGKRLYVSFGSQGLYAYDLDGNLLWERDLGQVDVTFGEGSSPALAGDRLFVVQDNNGQSFVYALDTATGKELWKKSRDEGSGWTTPSVLDHGGKTQVVISGSKAVRAYDPATGDLLWQCAGLGANPVPMIVADADTVYAMSGHRDPAGIAIRLGRTGDLTGTDAVRWRVERVTPYVPSPLLYDGLLFFCQRTSDLVTCLDAATGKPHYELARLAALSGVYASPILALDRIYLPGQNGATVVLAKGPELEILATNKLDDRFDASPAAVGNELFLRGHRNLYCLAAVP